MQAHTQYNIGPRGMGKTVSLGYWSQLCTFTMPGSSGVFVAPTYTKMLQDLLGPLIDAWKMYGYYEGVHYVIGVEPPKNWNWRKPVSTITDFKYVISWINGSVQQFLSQDKNINPNGKSVDWIIVDEAKYIDFGKFRKQLSPINRGNEHRWGHLPQHHSMHFYTDKLFDKRGSDWILDEVKKATPEIQNAILVRAHQLEELRMKLNHTDYDLKMIAKYEADLALLRKNCIAYVQGDEFENRYVLGLQYFKDQANTMSAAEFNAAIRNKTVKSLGGGDFYKGFDETINGYTPPYKSYGLKDDYDSSLNIDCRNDMGYDYDPDAELNINVDIGGSINCMTVVQELPSSFDCINEFYVLPPEKTKQLADKFTRYYKYHRYKVVKFRYDPSANNKDPRFVTTNAEDFAGFLRDAGWEVHMLSLGKSNTLHDRKHSTWKSILNTSNGRCIDTRFKQFRYNAVRCECLPISMSEAKTKVGRNGVEKDKSSESNKKIPQQYATHLSDTIDLYAFDKYGPILFPSKSNFSGF